MGNLFQIRCDRWIVKVGGSLAGITTLTKSDVDWDLTQERYLRFLGILFRAAFAKDVINFVVIRANKTAHVFHDSQNWNFDFAKHSHRFDRVDQSDLLRCANHNGTGDRQ